MDNQHKHINDYRDLTKKATAMNDVKAKAEEVGQLIEKLENTEGLDQRWVAAAKTDLQKGFMAAVRSIAQPTTF